MSHTLQGLTFHLSTWGQERLLTAAASGCLCLSQWMAKLWPEGPFMKAGRLTLTTILRKECNLNHNYASSRVSMGMPESVLLFSLPSYPPDVFLQMLAMLWAASGLFLAQLCCFPTSHLVWCPLEGKNCFISSVISFAWSEVPQSLGGRIRALPGSAWLQGIAQ